MADQQIGNIHGVTVAHVGGATSKTNLSGTATAHFGYENDNLDNIDFMRTRLAAIDAAYYTAARLNTMTYNDLIYAIRVADAPATIK